MFTVCNSCGIIFFSVIIQKGVKHIIELLKQRNILSSELSTLWENTDGCAEHYRCATALHLMSMLSQSFSVIIDRGISAPGHRREVIDDLNSVEKVVSSN